jgi:hypothetical protein
MLNILKNAISDDMGRISSTRVNILCSSLLFLVWTAYIAFYHSDFSEYHAIAYGIYAGYISAITGLRNIGTKTNTTKDD